MTNGPKECRDVTEGIIIMPAVTHCYLFTSLTEKGDLLAGITMFTLRTDEIFRLSRSEKKISLALARCISCLLSLALAFARGLVPLYSQLVPKVNSYQVNSYPSQLVPTVNSYPSQVVPTVNSYPNAKETQSNVIIILVIITA